MEGAGHDAGDPVHAVDLLHPFGHGREHGPEVHFLEALETEMLAVDLADEVATEGWLSDAVGIIGITAGASTPNNKIGEALVRLLQIRGIDPTAGSTS